jgi:hypothetical protein
MHPRRVVGLRYHIPEMNEFQRTVGVAIPGVHYSRALPCASAWNLQIVTGLQASNFRLTVARQMVKTQSFFDSFWFAIGSKLRG